MGTTPDAFLSYLTFWVFLGLVLIWALAQYEDLKFQLIQ
jgi:hypothetical protein